MCNFTEWEGSAFLRPFLIDIFITDLKSPWYLVLTSLIVTGGVMYFDSVIEASYCLRDARKV